MIGTSRKTRKSMFIRCVGGAVLALVLAAQHRLDALLVHVVDGVPHVHVLPVAHVLRHLQIGRDRRVLARRVLQAYRQRFDRQSADLVLMQKLQPSNDAIVSDIQHT